MKLADLNKDWNQDVTFSYKLGLIYYQCKVKYLPFCNENRHDYEKKSMTEIYTPVTANFESTNTTQKLKR